jgi:hypothetical protein
MLMQKHILKKLSKEILEVSIDKTIIISID